jgi:hypothetical protein
MRMFRGWFRQSKWRPCLRCVLPKSSVPLCVFCEQEDLMQRIFINKCFLFPVGKAFHNWVANSSKTVDKKQILRTISIVQVTKLVQFTYYISENSTANINALCNSCEDMACCSSVQSTVYCTVKHLLSRKPFGTGHMYTYFFA